VGKALGEAEYKEDRCIDSKRDARVALLGANEGGPGNKRPFRHQGSRDPARRAMEMSPPSFGRARATGMGSASRERDDFILGSIRCSPTTFVFFIQIVTQLHQGISCSLC